jgi:hypothetical protein
VRLTDEAALPVVAGVLQVRREVGLVTYPRGKSAMILYAGVEDVRAACRRLAAEHPGRAWLCRWNRDPVEDVAGAAARLLADFAGRFGAEPSRMYEGED